MRILDSQIHIFADNSDEYVRAVGQVALSADQIIAEMDDAGVAGAVLVPAGGASANTNCLKAAEAWPDRFRVMGRVSPVKPEGRALMADWAGSGYAGLRQTFAPSRDVSWLADGTADWLWAAAEEQDIPVMIWAPRQAGMLAEIAARHPRLRLIVDHFNLYVDDKGEVMRAEVADLLRLARHDNVMVKASSLPAHSDESWPWPDLHQPVADVISAFGADRVMWGTDLTRRSSTYKQAIDMFTTKLSFLDGAQLEKIMGGNLARELKW